MSVRHERTLTIQDYYGNSKVISFSPPAVMELRLKDASPLIFHWGALLVNASQNSGRFPIFITNAATTPPTIILGFTEGSLLLHILNVETKNAYSDKTKLNYAVFSSCKNWQGKSK